MILKVFNYLEKLINVAKPRKLLFMAIDGKTGYGAIRAIMDKHICGHVSARRQGASVSGSRGRANATVCRVQPVSEDKAAAGRAPAINCCMSFFVPAAEL